MVTVHPIAKRLPRSCGALLLVFCAAYRSSNAQQAQADPVCEVASIKRNTSGTAQGGRGALPGGRLSLRDRTVRNLLFEKLLSSSWG